jgi:hypothetical protein
LIKGKINKNDLACPGIGHFRDYFLIKTSCLTPLKELFEKAGVR